MEENNKTIEEVEDTTNVVSEAAISRSNNTLNSIKQMFQKASSSVAHILKNAGSALTGKLSGLKHRNRSSRLNYNVRPAVSDRNKKSFYKIGLVAVALILLIIAFYIGRTTSNNSSATYANGQPLPPTIQARQNLNKEFSFPLLDSAGKQISTVKYKITTAEIENSIIVNGQRANAVKGRTFLVLNLEITNNHTQEIQINSKDYVRLSVKGSDLWIAPDIHNDPVNVQAISTKITRLGFPINTLDKDLTLRVGEIKGTKQTVKLDLKQL